MITTLHDPVVTVHGGVLEHRTQVTFAPGTLPAALVLACRLSQDLRVAEPLPPGSTRYDTSAPASVPGAKVTWVRCSSTPPWTVTTGSWSVVITGGGRR